MSKNNKTLFKDAIADAKQVKEVAIAQAKAALEEAMAPQLSNIFSSRLQEMEDEELSEGESADLEEELDLDEILNELDSDLDEAKDDDKKDEKKDDKKDDDKKDDKPKSDSTPKADSEPKEDEDPEIGSMKASEFAELIAGIVADAIGGGEAGLEAGDDLGGEMDMEPTGDLGMGDELGGMGDMAPAGLGMGDEDEEDVNLDELLAELEALDESPTDEIDEAKENKEDLNEAVRTIKKLRNELNEINLLNAKLLYVNRIFKANNLNEGQKTRVIETLDKAESVKEVKLVYESLSVSLNQAKAKVNSKTNIKESLGFASKAAGISGKTSKIVEDATIARFRKLANIK